MSGFAASEQEKYMINEKQNQESIETPSIEDYRKVFNDYIRGLNRISRHFDDYKYWPPIPKNVLTWEYIDAVLWQYENTIPGSRQVFVDQACKQMLHRIHIEEIQTKHNEFMKKFDSFNYFVLKMCHTVFVAGVVVWIALQ